MGKQDFINRVVACLQENESGDISAEDLKILLIENFDDHIFEAVSSSDLASFIKKPVLAIVETLPDPDLMQIGNRYFIATGEDSYKISEWKGGRWEYQNTKEGDCIFCFQDEKFIVRAKEAYQLPANRDSYEVIFNLTESVIVNHNLNRYPSIVVMDSSNRAFVVQVTYQDRDTCIVSWTGETSGKIVCN
ncbi:MAG: hypothetical protein ACOYO1_12800 [Bacteroidales bacterium]